MNNAELILTMQNEYDSRSREEILANLNIAVSLGKSKGLEVDRYRALPEITNRSKHTVMAIAEIVDGYNSSRMTFAEAIRAISERKTLEEDVFWMVKGNEYTMSGVSDNELRKKIMAAPTEDLWKRFNWERGDRE